MSADNRSKGEGMPRRVAGARTRSVSLEPAFADKARRVAESMDMSLSRFIAVMLRRSVESRFAELVEKEARGGEESHAAPDRIAVAYHEAGHAVMSVVEKRRIKVVTIVPTQDYLGVCTNVNNSWFYREGTTPEIRARHIRREVRILLAGPASEERFSGRVRDAGSRGDYDKVWELASRLYSDRVLPVEGEESASTLELFIKFMAAEVRGLHEISRTLVAIPGRLACTPRT